MRKVIIVTELCVGRPVSFLHFSFCWLRYLCGPTCSSRCTLLEGSHIPCLLEYQAAMGGEEWREHEGLDGHEIDQDVEGRPRRVLERVADGVADHGGLVSVRPLGTQ